MLRIGLIKKQTIVTFTSYKGDEQHAYKIHMWTNGCLFLIYSLVFWHVFCLKRKTNLNPYIYMYIHTYCTEDKTDLFLSSITKSQQKNNRNSSISKPTISIYCCTIKMQKLYLWKFQKYYRLWWNNCIYISFSYFYFYFSEY